MTIKIAMIGAGSVVFARNLTGDILSLPEFKDCELVYMDIDRERLDIAGLLCRKIADATKATPRISTTMDRREAIRGATFVINMVQIGGFDSTLVDFEIPRRYGLRFTIADTTGPGGLFRALRTFPMLRGLCQDMMELCPNATLLNYSNPMSMNMQTVFRTSSIRAVGLCHSVQGTLEQLAEYINEKPQDLTFACAGVNHMAFYQRLEKDGVDLYPRLFAALDNPAIYKRNKVRFEIMRRLGYFITESSEHNAEYCSWFIPHGRKHMQQFDIPLDEYLRRCDNIITSFGALCEFARSPRPIDEVCASHEYCSSIMHAMITGVPTVIYGNLVNGGTISNLPRTAIVEAPTLVDRTGLHHAQVGELPPQLVGYIQPHVTQHELFIRAAMEGRRDHVYQACMFDPLTAAVLPPDRIVEMCDEMIAAYGSQLPTLNATTLVPTSGKTFGPVDGSTLRASWESVSDMAGRDSIMDWHIIGPFASGHSDAASLTIDSATAIDAAISASARGQLDLQASHRDGTSHEPLQWRKVRALKGGYLSMTTHFETQKPAVGYAHAEINDEHGRSVELRMGSNTSMRVWLNGAEIHTHRGKRHHERHGDIIPVTLKAGANYLTVKLVGHSGYWGFNVEVPAQSTEENGEEQ